MQRTQVWWEALTAEQRDEVLAMQHGHLDEWVLDSMAAAGIRLVDAEVESKRVRLPPVVTTDFIETARRQR